MPRHNQSILDSIYHFLGYVLNGFYTGTTCLREKSKSDIGLSLCQCLSPATCELSQSVANYTERSARPWSGRPQSPMLPLHHPGHGLSPPGGRNHAEWICLISLFMARYGSPQLAMLNSWYWIVVQQAIRNLCDWKLPLRAPSNHPKSEPFLCRFKQLSLLVKQCI